MKVYYSEAASSSKLTVSALNDYVKNLLEDDPLLAYCEVEGEISNFKHYISSGHMYFTLKDSSASIAAVMYRWDNQKLSFLPSDGDKVTVKGCVSLYSEKGQYQLYVREMNKAGEGDLYVAFEALKRKLSLEGLFDEGHKKELPKYPSAVGVITSKFGAALHDILSIAKRRFPTAEIEVYPSLVQGSGAAESLISALDYFDSKQNTDVVIIGRGGGSIEDLWCFNDERLARRIYDFSLPIVSAVGHETDYTVCDLVSDVRAATPSAAAELVFPDINELRFSFASIQGMLSDRIEKILDEKEDLLSDFSPKKISLYLMRRANAEGERLNILSSSLTKTINRLLSDAEGRLASEVMLLESANPLRILTRGYSVVSDSTGKPIIAVNTLTDGDIVDIRFSSGKAKAEIIETTEV